jgi:ADP-ribose pyrophosphatase YjhB (NUDIX family)
MNDFKCTKGCCDIYVKKYITNGTAICDTNRRSKAGALLYDEKLNAVLLVQSRGNLWGIPKGSLEEDESFLSATIREVKEETGIMLDGDMLTTYVEIPIHKSVYYFVKYDKCIVNVQDHIQGNDANSIGWINIDCLRTLIDDSIIKLNKHTKDVLHHFLKN